MDEPATPYDPLRIAPRSVSDVSPDVEHLCLHASRRDRPAVDGSLARLRRLRSLGLREHLDRLDLVALGAADLPLLRQLTLEGPFETVDLGRLRIDALPALHTLWFAGDLPRHPLGKVLSTMPPLPTLRTLSISHFPIGDAGLQELPTLNLHTLDLRHTRVSELATVQRLGPLRTLLARDTRLQVPTLAALPTLEVADLRTRDGLTEDTLASVTASPKLRRLGATIAAPGALAGLVGARIVGLWLASPRDERGRMPKKGERAQARGLGDLPELRTLSLVSLDATEADLEAIAALPALEILEIADVDWLSDRTIEILSASRSLRTIRVLWHDADPISRAARKRLREVARIRLTWGYSGMGRLLQVPWDADR